MFVIENFPKLLLDQIDDRFELLESIPSEEKFFYFSKVDLLNEKERLLKRLEELIEKNSIKTVNNERTNRLKNLTFYAK
ncbi:hypothetical protein [Leptospira noguchii]|uniref:hypothetical protein n=1 Tax=Leptospira noguchii TaxID=28182 RepID=UPI001E3D0CE8|nr:hypothetical protein [Leptospira noguchii]